MEEHGSLTFLRGRLELAKEFGDLLADLANRILINAAKGMKEVERKELEGKLHDTADNLDLDSFDVGTEEN